MAAPKKTVKEDAPEAPVAESADTTEAPAADVKTTTLTSPWGSKVIVAADQADVFTDAGYTK